MGVSLVILFFNKYLLRMYYGPDTRDPMVNRIGKSLLI